MCLVVRWSPTRASQRMPKMKRKSAELQGWRGRKKRGAEKGRKKQEGRRHVLDLDDLVLTNVSKFIQIRDLSMYRVVKSSTRASWRMLKMKRKSAELQARRGTKKRGAEEGQKKQEGRRHVLDLDDLVLTNVYKFIQIRDLSMYLVVKSSTRTSWRLSKKKQKGAELQAWKGTKKRHHEKEQKKRKDGATFWILRILHRQTCASLYKSGALQCAPW